jgi:hypothetical protein
MRAVAIGLVAGLLAAAQIDRAAYLGGEIERLGVGLLVGIAVTEWLARGAAAPAPCIAAAFLQLDEERAELGGYGIGHGRFAPLRLCDLNAKS